MASDFTHNLPFEAYRVALLTELGQASLDKARKAAIVEELEQYGVRNASENRADVETASQGRHADDSASQK